MQNASKLQKPNHQSLALTNPLRGRQNWSKMDGWHGLSRVITAESVTLEAVEPKPPAKNIVLIRVWWADLLSVHRGVTSFS